MNNKLMFSSEKTIWETPKEFFNKYNSIFDFNYDLAASKENTLCKNFFDIEADSLKQDWHKLDGWQYVNPPYGRGITDKWVKKCHEEAQKGAKILALLPARTDTVYFHDYIYGIYDVVFIRGRIKFQLDGKPILDKDGNPSAAPFPSMLVYFNKKK